MVSKDINEWPDFFDETKLVIMTNADLTFDYPKPLFPNVISVEGISVKPAKPLSAGMESYILLILDNYFKILKATLRRKCDNWI